MNNNFGLCDLNITERKDLFVFLGDVRDVIDVEVILDEDNTHLDLFSGLDLDLHPLGVE